jgi:hypothetical protein
MAARTTHSMLIEFLFRFVMRPTHKLLQWFPTSFSCRKILQFEQVP